MAKEKSSSKNGKTKKKKEVTVSVSWCPVEGDTVQLIAFQHLASLSPHCVGKSRFRSTAAKNANSVTVKLHSLIIPSLPRLKGNERGIC